MTARPIAAVALAVAVFIDVTTVRSVLVPASMTIPGRWNRCLPNWLGWLPNLNIEGRAHLPASAHRPAMSEGGAD